MGKTGRLVVFNHLTLDGVIHAPARPDEDRRGGFAHGGWAAPRMAGSTSRRGRWKSHLPGSTPRPSKRRKRSRRSG
jgi:hypothetical protein